MWLITLSLVGTYIIIIIISFGEVYWVRGLCVGDGFYILAYRSRKSIVVDCIKISKSSILVRVTYVEASVIHYPYDHDPPVGLFCIKENLAASI